MIATKDEIREEMLNLNSQFPNPYYYDKWYDAITAKGIELQIMKKSPRVLYIRKWMKVNLKTSTGEIINSHNEWGYYKYSFITEKLIRQ